jgi:hypothetical protein
MGLDLEPEFGAGVDHPLDVAVDGRIAHARGP